jgi:hypothetical protein
MKSNGLNTGPQAGIAAAVLGIASVSNTDAKILKNQTSSNASHFTLAFL